MRPTRRALTIACVVLLALVWPFLPEFTTVVVSYIGLYAIVTVGLVNVLPLPQGVTVRAFGVLDLISFPLLAVEVRMAGARRRSRKAPSIS